MELLNHTPHEARLFRTVLSESEMLGVIVVKATYPFDRSGRVCRDTARPFPISESFVATELGQRWPESMARKLHTEVAVFGKALAPDGRPVSSMDVSVRVGDREARLHASGPRVWQKRRFSFEIGPTAPFVELPLEWSRAYGGRATAKGRLVPFAQNPGGRGFLLDRDAVDGSPLPNLEDPRARISRWKDQPAPLAFAPLPLSSSLCELDVYPEDAGLEALASAPAVLRGMNLRQGREVVLRGLSTGGVQAFRLRLPHVFARTDIGKRRATLHCAVDTLLLYPQQHSYAVVARRSFRYRPDASPRVVRLHEDEKSEGEMRPQGPKTRGEPIQ